MIGASDPRALECAAAIYRPYASKVIFTGIPAAEMVKLTDHASLSRETVRRRLTENDLKPWHGDMLCIPQVDGTFVARMEDVLDLYAEAPDPAEGYFRVPKVL